MPALQRCVLHQAAAVGHWPIGPADAAVSLEFLAHELRWLQEIRAGLERALIPSRS